MKNILVPTDFSIQSLNTVHELVDMYPKEQVNIFLIHLVQTPDDIHDLLFSRKSHLMAEVPANFFEAIEVLKNKYATQVNRLGLEFYYGQRASVVRSIIENCKIDEVCIIDQYKYTKPFKQSVNILPLLDRCNIPVRKVRLRGRVIVHGQANLLSSLLMENTVFLPLKERAYPVS